jgi:hypothetical protein
MTTDVDDTSLVAKRLASVLINDSSTTTNYRVFQLRLQANTASTADLNVNIVNAQMYRFRQSRIVCGALSCKFIVRESAR